MEKIQNKGITLIALIITVIVLLILAGITINLTIGEDGIIKRAEEAGKNYMDAEENERNDLAQLTNTTDNIIANITGENYVKDISTVAIGDTHTVTTLTYSWEELEQIAEVISDNDKTINNDTLEVKVTIGGKEYTVGVGDLATLTYDGIEKTVRIMGFNHDELTDTEAYGEGKSSTYAGISFEFVNSIMSSGINSSDDNTNGWGGTTLRSTLNSETELNKLGNKSQIKEVNKTYLLGNKSITTQISQDKLWLLSCSEIWSNGYNGSGTYGEAKGQEGEQYKYYKDINEIWDSENTKIIKNYVIWWLRSPYYSDVNWFCFCMVDMQGCCNANAASTAREIIPGFAI